MNRIFAFLLAMFLIMGICFGCAKDEPIVETEPATTEMVIEEEKSTIPRVEITEPETEPEPEEEAKVETKPVKKPAATKPITPKPKPTPTPPTTVPPTTEPETTVPPTTTPPETTEPPVTEPEETTPPVEEDKEESNKVYLGRFKLTAYCNCSKCCGKWAGGPTATGTMPKQGRTIAVDPKVIPYGSRVMINGHTYIAEDCGGAIKNKRIDIYFDSHSACLQFGVQYADVYLVK